MRRPASERRQPYAVMRSWVCAATLSAVTLLIAACDDCCPPDMDFPEVPACLDEVTGPVALAVGARANQPAPALPAPVRTLVLRAAYAGQPIAVVNVDGDPSRLATATFSSPAQNSIGWEGHLETFASDIFTIVAHTRAERPEANPLEALSRASEEVSAGGAVVLLDSGLQTVPPLNFLNSGLLDADAGETADFLAAHGQLPDLDGIAVVLAGIGRTAEPQGSLDTARRENLRAIWVELAHRAGARCVEVVNEGTGTAPTTDVPPVSAVEVPLPVEVEPGCDGAVLRDAGQVRFQPDEAVFVDEAAALSALRDLADEIIATGSNVVLIGTTSSYGTEEGRISLSEDRAEAVRELLTRLGVPAEDVEATGVGHEFPGYVDDRDENGELIPDRAAQNRNVIVQWPDC